MQRVGQVVLYPTCEPLPMFGVGEPVRAVSDIGPSPYLSDARCEYVDIAIDAIEHRQLAGEPVVGDETRPHDVTKDGKHKFRVSGGCDLAVVGDLADIPQPRDIGARLYIAAHALVAPHNVENELVFRDRRPREPGMFGNAVE